MRQILAMMGLLGCTGSEPSPTTTTANAASPTEAATAPAKPTDAPAEPTAAPATPKAKGKGNRTTRSNGTEPHRVKGAVTAAEKERNLLARCSDGAVVFGAWTGEYPSPAVQLDRPLRTEIRMDPCGGTVTKGCTAPAGLYHPWAKDTDRPKDIRFAVRSHPQQWKLMRDAELGGELHRAGTPVDVLTYLAEGVCMLAIDGVITEDMCPQDGDASWKRLDSNPDTEVQMIRVQCAGASAGWMTIDDAFMKQSGVREGRIQGYGDVAKSP